MDENPRAFGRPATGQPKFHGIASFGRLPVVPDIASRDFDLAVLGMPFDAHTTIRPGARFGPRAIRQASVYSANSRKLETMVYDHLRCVDAGDVDVTPFSGETTLRNIESHVTEVQSRGAAVVALGGDHSILLPILRATAKAYPNLTLIQIDAHSDTAGEVWGEEFHHGTPVRHAIEEGLIRGANVFQIGIRSPLAYARQDDFLIEAGIHVLDMPGFHDAATRASFLSRLRDSAGTGPCYLTFDVDAVDPAFAPGTGAPVVGGLTSYEALDLIRSLYGLRFVGGDVVEVAPAYDHAEITSLLAAEVAFEIMVLTARSRISMH